MRPRALLALLGAALAPVPLAGAGPEPPIPTSPPTVVGVAAVGNQLTAQTGTWAASGPLTYGYQWYRCAPNGSDCLAIGGASSSNYTLVPRDAGQAIGLTVFARPSTGGRNAAYASLVGPIAPLDPQLQATGQPAITGSPVVGKTLEVGTGAWSPAPDKLSYVWQRCNANGRICTPIAQATGASYTPSQADVGHALVALVQATFDTTTQSVLSASTVPVTAADVTGPTPTSPAYIVGTIRAGEKLSIAPGLWSGVGDLAYHFQWYRCDGQGRRCIPVRGATAGTYRLNARDVGHALGATVRAADSTGRAHTYTSLVGPVAAPDAGVVSLAQPSLDGTAKVGFELRAETGSWKPTAVATRFAWLRCNANGRICAPIPAATGATYALSAADLGRRLVAIVTVRVHGISASALSAASATVT